MAVVELNIDMAAGVNYTHTTDNSSDWPSVPNNTYFYDKFDRLVRYKNSSGEIIGQFELSSVPNIESVTYSQMSSLLSSNSVEINRLYFIIDRSVYVRGMDENKISVNGIYIAKVIPNSYYNETATNSKGVFPPNTFNVFAEEGEVYIWGGRLWETRTTDLYSPVDELNLPTPEFSVVTLNDPVYENKLFRCDYNFDEDLIVNLWDDKGNKYGKGYEVSPGEFDITRNDFGDERINGNNFDYVLNNIVGEITNNSIKGNISGNIIEKIIGNKNIGNINDNGILTTKEDNEILYNTNNGSISDNRGFNSFVIEKNSNLGNINSNAGGLGSPELISFNSNLGEISNNSSESILNNSNKGHITNNGNNGRIEGNSNAGNINNNTNGGEINYNKNGEDITGNDCTSSIRNNSNLGYIRNVGNNRDAVRYNNSSTRNINSPVGSGDVSDSFVDK